MRNKKENIVNFIKLFLLTFIMNLGFWFTYLFIWFAVGLPQTNWAMAVLIIPAVLSEWGFLKWING